MPTPLPTPAPVTTEPVCNLLDIIEYYTGTKVLSIGNGPRGDEIIYLKRIGDDDAPATDNATTTTTTTTVTTTTVTRGSAAR